MSVTVKVGGQFLKDVTGASFSGQGLQATVGAYDRPMTQGEANQLREKLQEAREKLVAQGVKLGGPARALPIIAKEAGLTDQQLQKLEEFRLDQANPKKQPNPQIVETVTLDVKVDPNAKPGIRELRLMGPLGLTNPIRFEVGTLPEVYDSSAANDSPLDLGDRLPVEVNGRLLPGEVDQYTLKLKKGQDVLVCSSVRTLIPYIADAVPGWFQASLSLFDSAGKEVAFSDHSESYQDPSFSFKSPAEGTYTLEVRDGLYRGREDFVYRLMIGEKSTLPAPSSAGAPLNSDLLGIAMSDTSLFDSLPQVTEREPNNDMSHAQLLKLPCAVAGCIGKPGDVDVYAFKGHLGQKIVAEIKARRLGSPLDSYLQLTNSKGELIAFNDDYDDKAAATLTHQADSYLKTTFVEDDTYFLSVRDTEHKGGGDFTYRLRIGAPQPGFDLRMVPSSVTARAGSTVALTVYALRQDGFDGDIDLSLVGAPKEFLLGGHLLPSGLNELPVTLTVPGDPNDAPVPLQLKGTSVVDGKPVERPVRAADDMTQAFAYHHLVPEQELQVAVVGKANRGLGMVPPDHALQVPLGRAGVLHLGLPRPAIRDRIRLTMTDAPEGISLGRVTTDVNGLVIELRADPKKVKAGLRGNAIIEAYMMPLGPPKPPKNPPKNQAKKKPAPAQRPFSLGKLPAIPFEVVDAPAHK